MARLEEDDFNVQWSVPGISSDAGCISGMAEKIDSGFGDLSCGDVTKSLSHSGASCDRQILKELNDTDVCDSGVFHSNAMDIECEMSRLDITESRQLKNDSSETHMTDLHRSSDCSSLSVSNTCRLIDDIFCPDEDGDTKLHLAIIQPDILAATWMTVAAAAFRHSYDALLNLQNYRFRQTPLHLAVVTNQPQLVRVLVVCGANQNVRDMHGNTPMHLACSQANMACIAALASSVTREEQLQLIQYCQAVQLPAFVPPAIDTPDFFCLDYEGRSYVHLVQMLKQSNRLHILDYLVQLQCSQLNIQDGKSGQTVLHLAVKQHDRDLLLYLLRNVDKVNINQQDYSCQTALDIAKRLKLNDIAELLIKKGAQHSDSFGAYDDQSYDSSDDDDTDDYDDLTVGGLRLHTASCH